MYVPDRYRETDRDAIRAFAAQHPFATLVTTVDGIPRATHLPLLVEQEGDRDVIVGHLAKANPQWQDFDGRSALVMFAWGPHAYVSPRWYGEGRYVPTWNYVSVHMRGIPEVISDPGEHRTAIRRLTEQFEDTAAYSMDALPEDYLGAMLGATVAFRMPVDDVDAAFKLNQNRTPESRRGVISALERSEDSAARAIADLMRARLD
ncbi:MAG: FMN-binding negative transcriptional regulator [Dehalococcoidia bacterium]